MKCEIHNWVYADAQCHFCKNPPTTTSHVAGTFFKPKYFLYADGAEHIAKLANARVDELVRLVVQLIEMNDWLKRPMGHGDEALEFAKVLGERLVVEKQITEFIARDE